MFSMQADSHLMSKLIFVVSQACYQLGLNDEHVIIQDLWTFRVLGGKIQVIGDRPKIYTFFYILSSRDYASFVCFLFNFILFFNLFSFLKYLEY